MSETEDIDNNPFIQQYVSPLLEAMILDMFTSQPLPQNLVQFMQDWLNKNGNSLIETQMNMNKIYKQDQSFSNDEEEEDEVFDLPTPKPLGQVDTRSSVSAEVYGQNNKQENFVIKQIEKSEFQINKLKKILQANFLFKDLNENDLQIVINSFEECMYSKSETVIKQGDDGSYLYIVFEGVLSCLINDKKIRDYQIGDIFGELALLYNAPRAATIISDTESVLYALDRQTFNYIVKDSSIKKRQKYEQFLSTVEVLSSLDYVEKLKLADALKPINYKNNEYIVKQGDQGNSFYIIEQGTAIATKSATLDKAPETVFNYKAGDYFGELSLLKNTPRAANVIAQGELKVISIDRETFKRILGPLDEILKRNFSRYEKYIG